MRRALTSVAMCVVAALGAPVAGLSATGQADLASSRSTIVKLFFVALDDGGKSGKAIGCGDSIVAVNRQLAETSAPLAAAIGELLSVRDSHYGQSGLYNALAASRLSVERVAVADGVAQVQLTGTLQLSGMCDASRVDAQVRETALQFPTVKRVDVFVNGVALATLLSGR